MVIQGKTEQRARDGTKSVTPYAAAAAKSLQSCPTLCDPIDGSPPGSPIPGILQARTLGWVAISFSNAWNWKVKVKALSLDTTDILDWIILCGGYHPVYHDVFSSSFRFYTLDPGSTLVVTTKKMSLGIIPNVPWEAGSSSVENPCYRPTEMRKTQSERKHKVCGRKREQSTFQARESEKQGSKASQGLCMNTTALCWHSRYSEMNPTLSIQTHFVLQPLPTAHTPATPNKSSLKQHTLIFHTAIWLAMYRLPLVQKSVLCLRALSSSKASVFHCIFWMQPSGS